jgi:hypothetical protein
MVKVPPNSAARSLMEVKPTPRKYVSGKPMPSS